MTQRQFIVGTTPFPVQVHDDSERETQLFTGSLSGTHSASISAVAAQTLDTVTQAATLTVTVAATASQTLATVTQSATLAGTVAASATQTLDTVSQSVTGAVVVAADAAQTLETIAQAATVEVVVAAEAAPPQTGGAMVVGRAGSGRWRRADDDTVYLRARGATGRGRTAGLAIEVGPPELPSVDLAAGASTGRGRTGAVVMVAIVPLVALASRGHARVPGIAMTRDDTLEVLQIYEMMTRRRAA
jgi:hypothetical protein